MDLNKELKSGQAAVLVIKELSTDSLILTKRSPLLRNHPGEICFPGGVQEINDANLYATALRELNEELGVNENRITLIKKLQIQQTLLGVTIHPWLVSIESIEPYHLNTDEVAGLVLIPMTLVINPLNYRDLVIEQAGKRFISCEFIPNEDLVWGATARIMKQLASSPY